MFGSELASVVDEAQIDDEAEIGLVVRKIRGKQEIREGEFIERQGDAPRMHTCALPVKKSTTRHSWFNQEDGWKNLEAQVQSTSRKSDPSVSRCFGRSRTGRYDRTGPRISDLAYGVF